MKGSDAVSCPRPGKPCYEFMCGDMQDGICKAIVPKNEEKENKHGKEDAENAVQWRTV